jgi:hypothetical protein
MAPTPPGCVRAAAVAVPCLRSRQLADRAYIIDECRIFRGGSPEALERDPEVKRIYLGESFKLRL